MPDNAVGGVAVKVRLDDKDALRQLDSLKAKIAKLNDSLAQKRAQRDSIAAEMEKAEISAEKARQKVEQLQAALASAPKEDRAGIRAQLTAASADLREQTRNLDTLNRQWQKLDGEISTGEASLSGMTDQAANLEKQVAAGTGTMAKLQKATVAAARKMERSFSRLGRMIKRVFVLTAILRALRAFRDYFGSVLMSTPEFAQALGQLKSALLTLVQPIISIVIPAFVRLLQIVTTVVTALADLVSRLFGTTFEASQEAAQGLHEQADAYKATGSAAKKASKSLANFDQINKLENSGGGAGAAAAGSPLFDVESLPESTLKSILGLIEAIGAALLAWKISDALGLGLKGFLGLALLLYSTLQFIKAYLSAWDEGITWDNLKKLFLWLAGAALGAFLAFGKTGASVVLILGGLAIAVAAFKDAWENGISLENIIALLGGIGAAALGAGLIFGKAGAGIVLILGGIALAILAIKDAWENGVTWENMAALLGGVAVAALGAFLAFGKVGAGVVLIVGGLAMLVLGIKDVMENGLNLKNGLLIIAGILATGLGISLLTGSFIPLLVAAIVGVIAAVTMLGGTFENVFGGVHQLLGGFVKFFKGVFTGDMEMAAEGLKDIFFGLLNTVLGIVGGLVNVIVKGLNWVIDQLNKVSFDVPDWVPGIGGTHVGVNIGHIKEWEVPMLAQGAVIPPNREFMAVLGDQKSGTNIEAPLETIVQAFRQALGERGGSQRTIILQVDRHELGRVTFDAYNAESQRVGMKLGG